MNDIKIIIWTGMLYNYTLTNSQKTNFKWPIKKCIDVFNNLWLDISPQMLMASTVHTTVYCTVMPVQQCWRKVSNVCQNTFMYSFIYILKLYIVLCVYLYYSYSSFNQSVLWSFTVTLAHRLTDTTPCTYHKDRTLVDCLR